MNLVLGLLLLFTNQGVQINQASDKIDIVRTDQQAAVEHHPILDDPQYARLRPFTVTVRTHDVAIVELAIEFDAVDANGVRQSFPHIYIMPPGQALIPRNSTCEFWVTGKMCNSLVKGRQPLMSKPSAAQMDMFEQAKNVTVTLMYVKYADGTIEGPQATEYQKYVNANRPENKRPNLRGGK